GLDQQIFYVVFWYWLIQTACALCENNEFKSELIVNVEIENFNQENIILKLYEYYYEISKELTNKPQGWLYKRIKNTINHLRLEEKNEGKVLEKIKYILKKINENKDRSFILLNSTNEEKNFKSGFVQFCVIVGGFMISRGFTFENLTTEFFLNVPKSDSTKISVDTLLQRCRWFGNRKKDNRNKFLRIVMNKRICEALKSAQDYVEVFVPGTSTSNIGAIYKKIKELDEFNEIVESTNATKRK
ncbi:MAG: Z1 domain-containing protein, partial [Malacoplasma sp.]|nr:Z1 domain-containing protein [Malacoplasma sp.]